jgi:hypothetical protein
VWINTDLLEVPDPFTVSGEDIFTLDPMGFLFHIHLLDAYKARGCNFVDVLVSDEYVAKLFYKQYANQSH